MCGAIESSLTTDHGVNKTMGAATRSRLLGRPRNQFICETYMIETLYNVEENVVVIDLRKLSFISPH